MARNSKRRSILHVYRTYNFIDKDPVIDEMRTLVKDEGLIKKLNIVHELSGVSVSTLTNWFDGETKAPQNRTISAVATALGYERKWQKTKDLDIDAELKKAKAWAERQRQAQEEAERRVKRAPGRQTERRAST
jgi:hypothetical protein